MAPKSPAEIGFYLNAKRLPYPRLESLFQLLIWYSIGTYVIEEVIADTEHSREGWPGFLWSERIVALLFTLEYFLRWHHSRHPSRYPCSFMGIVDLISILPFYIGFFVPVHRLHLIRTLRILRLLKLYRYSPGLQLLALGFYRARDQLRAIAFAIFVLVFASQAAMYEAERYAQPEVFESLDDSFWFTCVTVTTVGYGDIYPITPAGRIVALITFILGVTLVATFTGVMGSAFASVLREKLEYEEAMASKDRSPPDSDGSTS